MQFAFRLDFENCGDVIAADGLPTVFFMEMGAAFGAGKTMVGGFTPEGGARPGGT